MKEVYFWLLQLVTGLLLFFLVGIHLIWLHFGPEGARSWGSMIERAGNGLWLVFYVLLLTAGLYHGLYGLRNIFLELSVSPATGRRITIALVALGVVALAFGTYVPVKLFAS